MRCILNRNRLGLCGLGLCVLVGFFATALRAETKTQEPPSSSLQKCVDLLDAEVLDAEVVDEKLAEAEQPSLLDQYKARLTEEEKNKIKDMTDELMLGFVEATRSRSEVADHVKSFATDVQEIALRGAAAVNEKAQQMWSDVSGARGETLSGLNALHRHIKINDPKTVLGKAKGLQRLIPQRLRTAASVQTIMTRAAAAFSSTQQKTDQITQNLQLSQDRLSEDNESLLRLHEAALLAQVELQKNVYLCSLLIERVKEELQNPEHSPEQLDLLKIIERRLIARHKDLATVLQVNHQACSIVGVLTENNESLCEQIQRTTMVVSHVFALGTHIESFLLRQRNEAEAVQKVREITAELFVNNSEALVRQNKAIAQLEDNTVIDLDSLHKAHANTMQVLDELSKRRERGFELDKQQAEEVMAMAAELQKQIELYEQHSLIAPPTRLLEKP